MINAFALEGFRRTFSALKHRNYRLYWFGQMVSLSGSWIQILAQGWLVLKLTDSPLYLGLVNAAASLPLLLLSMWGGVLADRFDKRKILLLTQFVSMLLAIVLGALISLELIKIWHVFLIAFLLGTVNSIDAPTRQAYIVELVGKEDLTNAIALNSAAFNGARIVGPAIAGFLISIAGLGWCFYLNGISFLAVLWGLWLIDLTPAKRHEIMSPLKNLILGLRYIRHTPCVLSLISLIAVSSVFGMAYMVLMPIFARDILNVGASGLGFLMTATGIGALIGALTLAYMGNFSSKGTFLLATCGLFSVAVFAFSLCRNYHLSLIIMAVAGWSLVSFTAVINTLLQSIIPHELRGRVMSVYVLAFLGLTPFGSFQAGIIAQWVGAPFALALGACICASAVLYLYTRRKALLNC
ncbi:MAG: MFS transporter [bacterium]